MGKGRWVPKRNSIQKGEESERVLLLVISSIFPAPTARLFSLPLQVRGLLVPVETTFKKTRNEIGGGMSQFESDF